MHTERTITNKPLNFQERNEYIIIGVNKINKQTYYQHQKTFNKIIAFGDEAWNKTINPIEIAAFIQRLNEYDKKLSLCK